MFIADSEELLSEVYGKIVDFLHSDRQKPQKPVFTTYFNKKKRDFRKNFFFTYFGKIGAFELLTDQSMFLGVKFLAEFKKMVNNLTACRNH